MIGKRIRFRRRLKLWFFFDESATIEGTIIEKVRESDGKDYYLLLLPTLEVIPFDPIQKFEIID